MLLKPIKELQKKVGRRLKQYRAGVKVCKIVGFSFAGCVLFLILFLFVAGTPIIKGTLHHFSGRLEKEFGLLLTFKEVRVKSFLNVSIDSLFIASADQKIIVHVKTVNAKLSLFDFFYKKNPIQTLELDEPSLFVQMSLKSRFSFPEKLFGLPDIHVKDGRVHLYLDDKELSLSGISARFDSFHQKHHIQLGISDLFLAKGARHYLLNELNTLVSFDGRNLLRPDLIKIETFFIKSPEFQAEVTGRIYQHRSPIGWQFEGKTNILNFNVNDIRVPALTGEVIANQHYLEMQHVKVNMAATQVHAALLVEWKKGIPFALQVEAQGLSLYDLLAELDIPKAWTELGINLEAQGTGHFLPQFHLSAKAQGNANNLVVTNGPAREVKAQEIILQSTQPIYFDSQIEVDKNAFHFYDMHFNDDFSKGVVDCSLFFDKNRGLALHAKLDQANFSSINYTIGDNHYEGFGLVDVNIRGPYEELKIGGDFAVAGLSFESYELGRVSGDAKYHNNYLSFAIDEAKIGNSQYKGTLGLLFDSTIDMDLNVDLVQLYMQDLHSIIPNLQANFLYPVRDLSWKGSVFGHINLKGPIEKEYRHQLLGSGEIEMTPNHEWFGGIVNDGKLRFHLDDEFIYVDQLTLTSKMAVLNGSGKMHKLRRELQANLSADQLDLEWLPLSQFKDIGLKGKANLTAEVGGKINDILLNANLHASNIETKQVHIGDADLSLSLHQNQLFIQGPIFSTKGYAYLQLDLAKDFPFSGNVIFQYTSLDEILTNVQWPDQLKGFAGAEIAFSGKANSLLQTKGKINLYPVAVTYGNLKLISSGSILAQFKGPNLEIERWVMQTSHGDSIRLKGRLSLDNLLLRVHAQGDLWMLPFLDERIEMAYGDFFLDVDLSGNILDPFFKGQWRVENASVSARDYAYVVEDIELSGSFDQHQLYVDTIRGSVKDGSFVGDGYVTLKQYWPYEYNLGVQFTKIPILSPWMTGNSSGKLQLKGLTEDPLLVGDMTILEALITKEFDFDRPAKGSYFGYRLIDNRRKNSKPLRFDIHIKGDKEIRIENSFLNAALEADVVLVGNKESPALKGTVDTISGDVFFRNHRYRLQKAKVYFDNPYRIVPHVDIEAEGRVEGYDIWARFEGNLENTQLQLQSRPSLPEVDILSLMTMGFTNREVKDTMKTAQAASLEVLSMYSGIGQSVAGFLPRQQKKGGVYLDDLRFTSFFSHRGGVSLPALVVGVNIWNGMKLKLQSALVENEDGNREQWLLLEHRLNRNIRWRLSWNSEGQSNYGDAGVDLWYRLDL